MINWQTRQRGEELFVGKEPMTLAELYARLKESQSPPLAAPQELKSVVGISPQR
jgi:hypothetical protein